MNSSAVPSEMSNLNVTSQPSWDGYNFVFTIHFLATFQILFFFCNRSIYIFLFIIVSFGLVGNATVIRILGFHIKLNAFTTYILNLAVADFGVLLSLAVLEIILLQESDYTYVVLGFMLVSSCILDLLYNMGQLLLTTISIDRCVAVFFPIWHRCHRPPKLSTFVCVLLWLLSFMISVINVFLLLQGHGPLVKVIVNVLICYPLMATSTLTLFVKVRYKQHNRPRTKSLTIILFTLLFFLIFSIPVNLSTLITYYCFLHYFFDITEIHICLQLNISENLFHVIQVLGCMAITCVALNSSVNPVLYFLLGREKKSRFGVFRAKVFLQRVFQDEEDQRQEEQAQVQTPPGSL